MEVKVASCSVEQLFKGMGITASDKSIIKGGLHLPEYQRPYRWKEEQLKRLLKDLKTHFVPPKDAQPANHEFYIGSIILHQQTTVEGEQLLNIIDGQQRLTTLALIAYLQQEGSEPTLTYDSPISQNQIRKNLKWLKDQDLKWLKLANVNITLVVTHSEDDAYRFFETQNTGGVRLGGVDIIKAHHLRATPQSQQNDYAKQWEKLGSLDVLIEAILKARHWSKLEFRPLPNHRQSLEKKNVIVNELAEQTGQQKTDIAYQQISVIKNSGDIIPFAHSNGYAMRQPLNAGINAIHYLEYFYALRRQLLVEKTDPQLNDFYDFYHGFLIKRDGCDYLKNLFDSTVLLYASQFGTQYLYQAALWLFRVVYSPRVKNEKVVREDSVPKLVRESPVFDWILMSFNHEQCIERLKKYSYIVDPKNIPKDDKTTTKKRFIVATITTLGMEVEDNIAASYDSALIKAIEKITYQGER